MKFALIDGIKTEAHKGAKGVCPGCGSELIAKCGEVNVNHWAHKGKRNCDPWWEETVWHRSWKNLFPTKWQEVVHTDVNGEKHIADVKTDEGWVLEFQHSPIKPEEKRSRNAFYPKIAWIVDGLRRKRDISQFLKVIKYGTAVKYGNTVIYRVNFPQESRLLTEWISSDVPIFFDFHESQDLKQSILWFLIPKISNETAYLIRFSGDNFVELHRQAGFNELAFDIIPQLRDFLDKYERNKRPVRIVTPNRRRRRRRF